ncbi:hypothetical protein E2C01_097249 [Portunus trituberculatus]|uniref:Uncharacterized protein n=1 Tax=Portunus trituberculatus TaxID=210409 RepID=A0A5B7K9G6_PORTR|nr:hypothetical protein [Portunus trituberculatus]
MAATVCLC